MIRRKSPAVALFAIWTLFVWAQRIVNVIGDDKLQGGDRAGALVRPAVFVGVGLALGVVSVRPASIRVTARIVKFGSGLTIVVWVVQSALIATRSHSTAFVTVHLVLGLVSIALAVGALRSIARPAGESAPGAHDRQESRRAAPASSRRG